MRESDFQSNLKKKIKKRFPGSMILKNDPSHLEGVPDLLVLHQDKWAALECKNKSKAHKQPLQPYYISKMNDMSYASIVSPENEKEVLDELDELFNPKM